MRVERNTTHDALHAIGATRVEQVDIGVFEIEPDTIDLTLLDAAETETRKTRLRTYTNAKRDTVALGGFVYDTATYDSDPLSVSKISGAAIQASEAKAALQAWSIVWTDASNVDHTLNAQQMIDMHAALVSHGDSAHQTCRQVKADIDAGTITSEAEVDSANWP